MDNNKRFDDLMGVTTHRPNDNKRVETYSIYQPKNTILSDSIINHYKPDRNGILHIDFYPDCFTTMLMFPFPCVCVGCCLSTTNHLTLDYQERSINASKAPGYLHLIPCCRTVAICSFDDIDRIGYVASGSEESEIRTYTPVILLKGFQKQKIAFGPDAEEQTIVNCALGMHYYIYGRGNPESYQLPHPSSLRIWPLTYSNR